MKNADTENMQKPREYGCYIFLEDDEKIYFYTFAYNLRDAINKIGKDLKSDRYKDLKIKEMCEIKKRETK
jgi:hypothetical protein